MGVDATTDGLVTVDEAREDLALERGDRGGGLAIDEREQIVQVAVTHEPLTYRDGAPYSYFRDLVLGERGDAGSTDRLEQHAKEMRVELPKREERARQAATRAGVEYRANPSRAVGAGGSFSPPLWLIDQFATAPRPGRVLSDLAPNFLLPKGAQSISVPRMTTGTVTGIVSDLGAAQSRDFVDAQVQSPVATIDGEADVSLQLLEQSPPGAHLDMAVFKDLRESYDHQLEIQLINGSGTGGQLLGLLNVPGINAVTFTSAGPTGALFVPLSGQAIARIGDNRGLPPETWLVRTARWAWLVTSEDTAGAPLFIASIMGDMEPVGEILTIPTHLDDAIPNNLGAGSNQDVLICCRPSDMLVFESDPTMRVMVEVLSGTLQARLQLYAFAAALLGRYPSGISVVSGTGMVVQTGF